MSEEHTSEFSDRSEAIPASKAIPAEEIPDGTGTVGEEPPHPSDSSSDTSSDEGTAEAAGSKTGTVPEESAAQETSGTDMASPDADVQDASGTNTAAPDADTGHAPDTDGTAPDAGKQVTQGADAETSSAGEKEDAGVAGESSGEKKSDLSGAPSGKGSPGQTGEDSDAEFPGEIADGDDFDYDVNYDEDDFDPVLSAVESGGPDADDGDDVEAFRAASEKSRSRSADSRRKRVFLVRLQRGGLIALGVLAVLLVVVYVCGCIYFSGHFGFRTTLNGTDVSLKSEEEVEAALLTASEGYVLTIEGRGGVSDAITAAEIDLEPVFDGTIGVLLKDQSALTWPATLLQDTVLSSDSTAAFSEEALAEVISDLAFFEEENIEEPTDAFYTVSGGELTVVSETEGSDPLPDAVTNAIVAALEGFVPELTLGDDCYRSAEITSENEELLETVEALRTLLSADITLELTEEVSETVEAEDILLLLAAEDGTAAASEDEDTGEITFSGTLSSSWQFSEELVTAWVNELAEQYDTYGDDKEFETTRGDTVTVPGGNYGWLMDRESTAAALTEVLNSGEGGTVTVVWTQTAEVFGEDDIGDTYVEADLDEQKVYLYVDGELVLESNCVSGKAIDSSRATPNGVFRITYKKSPATLTGEGYESYVTYWMPFYYGYGFHDATWRSSFGGELYLTNGSHGCVNLPKSAAKTLYEYVYTGMPVIVHGGMSVEEAVAYTGQSVSSSTEEDEEEEETDTSEEEAAAAAEAQAELEAQIIEMAEANYVAQGMTEEEAAAAVQADLAEQLAAQQAAAAAEAQAQAQTEE